MAKAKPAPTLTPTLRAYKLLEEAHVFFNRDLFGGSLPPVLITMQRHAKAFGYFSGERFSVAHGDEGAHVDEIAMNPQHFAERSIEKTLSTLGHEMVHEWQHHHGRRPSRCYHDKQWAAKMKEVGLYPSDTAAPGGKETGAKVSHYILEGGPFAKSCAAFLKTQKGIALYQDRAALAAAVARAKKAKGEDDEGEDDEAPAKSPGRVKFHCLGCELNAWAKPSAKLRCDDCDRPLRVAEAKD